MLETVNLALIESYIGENFLTYAEFCKRCGISTQTFYKIRKNLSNVRLNAILKIARAINVELKDLFAVNRK